MMTGAYPSEAIRVACAVLSPYIALFGLYIIAHGHYGPGGGFAGGVFVAVGAILPRLTLPTDLAFRLVPTSVGPIACGVGLLGFLVVGVVPLFVGGAFLDYAAIEVAGIGAPRLRYLGILVVEVAVGLAVAGAMIMIFDVLTGPSTTDSLTPAGPQPPRDGRDAGATTSGAATPSGVTGAATGLSGGVSSSDGPEAEEGSR